MIPNALHLMAASVNAPRMSLALPSGIFGSGVFGSGFLASGVLSAGVFSSFEGWAQVAIERVVHSLPEGILIALFAWTMLRFCQNKIPARDLRVWFTALLAVVGLACIATFPRLSTSDIAPNATSEWGTHARFGRGVLLRCGLQFICPRIGRAIYLLPGWRWRRWGWRVWSLGFVICAKCGKAAFR